MDKEPGQEFCEIYAQAFADENGTLAPCDLWERLSDSQKSAWARIEQRMRPSLAEVAATKARVAELEEALATNEIERQEQIKERKRAEASVRAWEMATGETKPRIVKARLEERDAIVSKPSEAIELAECPSDDDICAAFDALHRANGWKREEPGTLAFFADGAKWAWKAALNAYRASLTHELPPDLPAPGRDRDAPRRPTVDRMDAAPARDEHLDRPEDRPGHVCEVGGCPECDKAARKRDERAKLYQCTPCLTWQEPEYGGRCRACGRSKEEHEGREQ